MPPSEEIKNKLDQRVENYYAEEQAIIDEKKKLKEALKKVNEEKKKQDKDLKLLDDEFQIKKKDLIKALNWRRFQNKLHESGVYTMGSEYYMGYNEGKGIVDLFKNAKEIIDNYDISHAPVVDPDKPDLYDLGSGGYADKDDENLFYENAEMMEQYEETLQKNAKKREKMKNNKPEDAYEAMIEVQKNLQQFISMYGSLMYDNVEQNDKKQLKKEEEDQLKEIIEIANNAAGAAYKMACYDTSNYQKALEDYEKKKESLKERQKNHKQEHKDILAEFDKNELDRSHLDGTKEHMEKVTADVYKLLKAGEYDMFKGAYRASKDEIFRKRDYVFDSSENGDKFDPFAKTDQVVYLAGQGGIFEYHRKGCPVVSGFYDEERDRIQIFNAELPKKDRIANMEKYYEDVEAAEREQRKQKQLLEREAKERLLIKFGNSYLPGYAKKPEKKRKKDDYKITVKNVKKINDNETLAMSDGKLEYCIKNLKVEKDGKVIASGEVEVSIGISEQGELEFKGDYKKLKDELVEKGLMTEPPTHEERLQNARNEELKKNVYSTFGSADISFLEKVLPDKPLELSGGVKISVKDGKLICESENAKVSIAYDKETGILEGGPKNKAAAFSSEEKAAFIDKKRDKFSELSMKGCSSVNSKKTNRIGQNFFLANNGLFIAAGKDITVYGKYDPKTDKISKNSLTAEKPRKLLTVEKQKHEEKKPGKAL